MCWHTVTLRLNLYFLLLLLLFWTRRGRGEFMALQLLALVTVNWPLSGAVKVFYGPCLCRDSVRVHTCEESRATDGASLHLTTELGYSKPQAHDYWWWCSSVPLASPLLFSSCVVRSFFCKDFFVSLLSQDRETKRLLLWWLSVWESCAYLWTETLRVAPRHLEGTSTTKDLCLLQCAIDFHHSGKKPFMEERKWGFSNNLRKLQKTLFTS